MTTDERIRKLVERIDHLEGQINGHDRALESLRHQVDALREERDQAARSRAMLKAFGECQVGVHQVFAAARRAGMVR
jgi:phage shock protein A